MSMSRIAKSALVAATLVAGVLSAPAAWAGQWHGGWHGGWGRGFGVGVVVGGPLWWGAGPYWDYWGYPGPYPYPYYYPPVAAVAPADPTVYVERPQGAESAPPPAAYYWYFCGNPNGYYPYVKECPGGWKKVLPTPPNPQ